MSELPVGDSELEPRCSCCWLIREGKGEEREVILVRVLGFLVRGRECESVRENVAKW